MGKKREENNGCDGFRFINCCVRIMSIFGYRNVIEWVILVVY